MKPAAQLCARLRFTTKQVGRGFYRGNRTGSKGAHTGFGGYVIDWRKTSHYNVPNTEEFSVRLAGVWSCANADFDLVDALRDTGNGTDEQSSRASRRNSLHAGKSRCNAIPARLEEAQY